MDQKKEFWEINGTWKLTKSGEEGDAEGEEREEGIGLLVLVPALGDADEVDAVPDDARLDGRPDPWP